MGMTDAEIAAARARMEAAAPGPSSQQQQSPRNAEDGGAGDTADSQGPKPSVWTRFRQRPILFWLTGIALAGLFTLGVQAALSPFVEVGNNADQDVRTVAFLATTALGALLSLFFVPFNTNALKLGLLWQLNFVAVIGLSYCAFTWATQQGLAQHIEALGLQAKQEKVNAMQASIQRQITKAKRVHQATNEFALPIPNSQCAWLDFPVDESLIVDRESMTAYLAKQKTALNNCLHQELVANLAALNHMVETDIGGSVSWEPAGESATSWRNLGSQLSWQLPDQPCGPSSSCKTTLDGFKQQAGDIAQRQYKNYHSKRVAYIDAVANPTIREARELERWLKNQQAEEAQEQARHEANMAEIRRQQQSGDGGMAEALRGIAAAADTMSRRTQSPTNRYQETVDSNARHKAWMRQWNNNNGITLDSETREPSPEPDKKATSEPPKMKHHPGANVELEEVCIPPLGKYEPSYVYDPVSKKLVFDETVGQRAQERVDRELAKMSPYCREKVQAPPKKSTPTRGKAK